MTRRRIWCVLAAAAAMLQSSCGSFYEGDVRHLGAVAWSTDGIFVLQFPQDTDGRPWPALAQDGQIKRVHFKTPSECAEGYYDGLDALPDGRISAIISCDSGVKVLAFRSPSYAYAMISKLPIPASTIRWNRDLSSGWAMSSRNSCLSIAPVTPEGVSPMSPLLQEAFDWTLDADFLDPLAECTRFGESSFPMPARSGDRLYFLASPESRGHARSSEARKAALSALYEADLRNGGVRIIASELEVVDAALSPVDDTIVMSGAYQGTWGIWIVKNGTAVVTPLVGGRFGSIAWAPNGDSVAAVDWAAARNEIRVIQIAR